MNALVIGVHNDDCETMGGTINLLVNRGVKVTILNVMGGETNSLPVYQGIESAKILGADKIVLKYLKDDEDRWGYKNNAKSIKLTENVIRDIKPDIIFMMHPKDNHIEHIECSKTAREAIFAAAVDGIVPNEIYTYECGQRQTMCYFEPDIFINVESRMDKIKESYSVFNTQHADGNYLLSSRNVRTMFRGGMVDLKHAEAFKIVKYPSKNNDFILREVLHDEFRWCENGMYLSKGEIFQ